jgi:hypothetical protein
MTFALLRAGLPNTIVAAALALVPIVALALSQPAPSAPANGADLTVASGGETGASVGQAAAN